MRNWCLRLSACLVVLASLAFGQVGNGTITGTIRDPAGAVVSGAAVEARNAATGVVSTSVSTNTGNFTVPDLPVGTYVLSVKVQGFKTYTHANLTIAATQILREDVALEVGAATEAVTVTAEATLLKTETAEMSHNVTVSQLDDLPLLGIGTANSGTSGVKNPYNMLQILPGVSSYASSGQFTFNGLGGNMTETMRIEGQDATSRLFGTYDYTQMGQPSADAIQEVAFQASNYSPEFGQAGSVVINMTMRSGTNQYHGSGFDYFVNEDLNAGNPFSSTAQGQPGKYRPRNRRNDFGGTLGGPVYIPKIYNGHNRTFFFFNYEQFLETTGYGFTDTVPVPAYLNGDFSAISPNGTCSLCKAYGIQTTPLGVPTPQMDALGRPMFANEIYDPLSRGTTGAGLGYANPFPNNMIPPSRFDTVALNLEKLFPAAQNSNLINNYSANIQGGRYTAIPSFKIDQVISDKDKLSFYWTRINTESQISSPLGGADGLPLEIGAYRGTFIPTYTMTLNYDRTITPTILLHLGAGFYHTKFFDHAPVLNFDPASVGLSGFVIHRQFPSITGLNYPYLGGGFGIPTTNLYGGMQNLGEAIQTLNYEEKPSYTANVTWIRGNHTYKTGTELYLEQAYNGNFSTVTLTATTAPLGPVPAVLGATAQPFVPTVSLNGFSQGFGYANFLLGDYTSTTQAPQENYRQGQQAWAMYIQDSWKVTRKLTLDYGIRWDLDTPYHEQYGRFGQLSETLANANAGGHPGATIFASNCGCPFYQPSYPYAIGPRLGVAYQINPKTVFRGGWGVNYQFIGASAGGVVAANGAYPLAGINPFVNIEAPGAIVAPSWPVTDPNRYPVAGTVGGGLGTVPVMPDANQNRPPRINQWSIGIQREITRNFILEAAYVGNRGVWEQGAAFGGSGPLGFLSQISPAQYAKYGLFPYPGTGPCASGSGVCATSSYNNDADRALLTQPISSTAVISRMKAAGISNLFPYSGFPATQSLASSLVPFPQFGTLAPTGSATGDSRYDSLQIKATKRLSHNLQAGGAYTWAKGFVRPTVQDIFNPAANPWALQQIPPQVLTFNATYTVPKFSFLPKVGNTFLHDWQIGFFANYQSGVFLVPPISPTANFLPSEDVRTGQPLYLKDINNIHGYNPYTDVVLNPAAWAPCPTNSTCAAQSTLYSNFRGPRQPKENGNLGRNFRFGKEGRYDLYIRGEFVNLFNRTIMPNPTSPPTAQPNPAVPPTRIAGGTILTSGFGVINAFNAPGTGPAAGTIPLIGRTGTLIARFTF